MKSLLLWLCLSLNGILTMAQTQTVDKLPEDIFGEYNNSSGQWTVDFNKDYFLNGRNAPFAFYQSIENDGDVYILHLKKIKDDEGEYTVKLKKGEKDTLWIADEISKWVFNPYVKLAEEKIAFPEAEDILKGMVGEWYLTDGSDQKYIEFYEDHCVFENESYAYSKYIQHGNTKQVNISGSKYGRFIHLRYIKPDYISIYILGESQKFLKRSLILPNLESVPIKDVPEYFFSSWYATNGDNVSIQVLPDYNIILNNEKIKMKRMTYKDQKLSISLNTEGEKAGFSLEQINDGYCKIAYDDGIFYYLKNSTELPDGLSIKNELIGEWFSCDGLNSSLTIDEKKVVTKHFKIKSKYDDYVSDGQKYKALDDSKAIFYAQVLNDDYVNVKFSEEADYKMYKRKADLPNEAEVEIKENLISDWINKSSGEWILSLEKDFAVYKNDFWNYGKIVYADGRYKINLNKTDTVCYYNQKGEYVCEFVDRSAQLNLALQDNLEAQVGEGKGTVTCVNHITKSNYRLNCDLPTDSKPGTAVLKGFISNISEAYKNGTVDIIVNDMLYCKQVSYSSKLDDNGKLHLNIPLATAQDVMVRMGNFFETLFLVPGDTLMIKIDGRIKTNSLSENSLFMGEYASFNQDLAKYNKFIRASGISYQRKDEKNYGLEPEEYKETRLVLQQEKLSDTDKFFANNQVSDGFKDWLHIRHEIDLNNDLMRYCWLRSIKEKKERLTSHPTYFSFINSLDVSNQKYWTSNYFQNYLHELTMHFDLKYFSSEPVVLKYMLDNDSLSANEKKVVMRYFERNFYEGKKILVEAQMRNRNAINNLSKDPKEPLTLSAIWNIVKKIDKSITSEQVKKIEAMLKDEDENGKMYVNIQARSKDIMMEIFNQEYIKALLEQYNNNVPYGNFLKKVALSKEFHTQIEQGDLDQASYYQKAIQNIGFSQEQLAHIDLPYKKVVEEMKKPLPEYCKLNDAPAGSADELLSNLAKKHEGKVIYIDVWAPWCGPCLGEHARSGPLKEGIKDKEVVLVYLCGSGDKNAWENMIKKYDLKGDHYYLESTTYSDLGAKFGITGIPRYMIMNRKGQVVDQNAPRPSNLQVLLNELNKHLEE